MMSQSNHRARPVKALRIYCPVDPGILKRLLAGETAAIDEDATLAGMLGVVRGHGLLGDFDSYKAVVELAPGWELFTPTGKAKPTLGAAGVPAVSPTAILTVYIPGDTSGEALDLALNAVVKAHPWEVPVIEIAETQLLVRA